MTRLDKQIINVLTEATDIQDCHSLLLPEKPDSIIISETNRNLESIRGVPSPSLRQHGAKESNRNLSTYNPSNSLAFSPQGELVTLRSQEKTKIEKGLTGKDLPALADQVTPRHTKSFEDLPPALNSRCSYGSRINLGKTPLLEVVEKVIRIRLKEALSRVALASQSHPKHRLRPLELDYSECEPPLRDGSAANLLDSQGASLDQLRNVPVLHDLSPWKMDDRRQKKIGGESAVKDEQHKEALFFEMLSPVLVKGHNSSQKEPKIDSEIDLGGVAETSRADFSRIEKKGNLQFEGQVNAFGYRNPYRWLLSKRPASSQLRGHSKQPSNSNDQAESGLFQYYTEYSPIRETTKYLHQLSRELQLSIESKKSLRRETKEPNSALKLFIAGARREQVSLLSNQQVRKASQPNTSGNVRPLKTTPRPSFKQDHRNKSNLIINIASPQGLIKKLKSKLGHAEPPEKKRAKVDGGKRHQTHRNSTEEYFTPENRFQPARLSRLLKSTEVSNKKASRRSNLGHD
jgi:hypothetical protein